MRTNARTMDLTKTHKYTQAIQTRNNEDVAGVCIVFRNDSILCMCSGLRFFSDPQGINNF